MLNLIDAAWWILLIVGIILLVGGWRGLQKEVHYKPFYSRETGWIGGGPQNEFKFSFGGCLSLIAGLAMLGAVAWITWKFGKM